MRKKTATLQSPSLIASLFIFLFSCAAPENNAIGDQNGTVTDTSDTTGPDDTATGAVDDTLETGSHEDSGTGSDTGAPDMDSGDTLDTEEPAGTESDTGGGDTLDTDADREIQSIGTTQVWDKDGRDMVVERPAGSEAGDLLVLVLHRTDDDLPLFVDGWTRVAECYKRDNGYDCSTEADCVDWHNDDFCADFGEGAGGHDLAQSVFYKVVEEGEPSSYEFDLDIDTTGHPGWAILTALRGAATSDPVRDWSNTGCDGNPDSLFPSVYGEKGDMVLLSQSFDDAIAQDKFNPPDGTTTFGYVSNSDEAGFLFGGLVSSTGDTGEMKTHGDGGPNCKDALVSLTIKPL